MRTMLVNWMFELVYLLGLTRRTIHLAVGYLDVYLAKNRDFTKDQF